MATKYTNAPTGYEAALVTALEAAVNAGLCSANAAEHTYLYEDLCAAAYHFIEKTALAKHRSRLESCGLDPCELANEITQELFFRKLDYIMHSDDPVNCRGLIVNTVKFRVQDAIKRQQNKTFPTKPEESCSTADVHFTDVGWSLIPSDTDLEQEAITGEECLAALEAFKRNKNCFEVVSFFATKLIGYKAGQLAEDLITYGNARVYASVLAQAAQLFGLEADYFSDAAFEPGEVQCRDAKTLADHISHGSDRAKNKVKRYLSRSRA